MTFKRKFVISFFSLLIFIILAAFLPIKKNNSAFDKIKVEGGYISGTVNSTGDIHIFKGVPFAAPPVGDLRWREPQPVQPWSGVRKAVEFGPRCVQGKVFADIVARTQEMNETAFRSRCGRPDRKSVV